jgi:GT2 family glycosyltransferase
MKPSRFNRVLCRPSGIKTFTGQMPPGLQAGWHFVLVHARQSMPKWIAVLRMGAAAPEFSPIEITLAQPYIWNPFGVKFGVFYLPRAQERLEVDLYSKQTSPAEAQVTFIRVFRVIASLIVCLQNIPGVVSAFGSTAGNFRFRFRKAIAATAINGQYLPKSYANWLSCFDDWPQDRIAALLASPHHPHRPIISAIIFCASGDEAALAATRDSLESQIIPPCEVIIHRRQDHPAFGETLLGEYVAILQAGEIIPSHALLLLSDELVRLHYPETLFADEDIIDETGKRSLPLFKPEPNLTLMCSGLLSRGIWLIRREWLEQHPPDEAPLCYAEAVRLAAWFRVYEAGRAAATKRVPYLLTHRSTGAENAPPEILAAVVSGFLARAGFDATVKPSFPLRIQWRPGVLRAKKVSLIVPSCLRGETQLACLREILEKTAYPNFEMLVLVTQPDALDEEQERAIAPLRAHPNFRVEIIPSSAFNYSAVNNIGAAGTDGDFLCLLNDDVAPMESDWLDRMVSFFADRNCGIVGAKLFYPNLTTQHGGVIMGLAGLVEHANRFLPRGNPGYAFRAELDQELSAVTGACMLVRRDVFEQVNGLDETFPTAFNDVDFCLRVRAAGFGIVFAASVEMIHHETLTFGQHYSPEKTEQEATDIQRLRTRWSEICKTDPFHNPNLSLVGRSEWNLAYPPRKQAEPIA